MKPIKLQLLLENCEILEFDWEHVDTLSFENTYDAIDIENDGTISTVKCCQRFFICVSGGGEYSFDNGSSHWTQRLKNGDITHIYVMYENGDDLTYRVEWPRNGNAYYHPYQGVYPTWMDGVYSIYCCKETKELHEQEEIENEE